MSQKQWVWRVTTPNRNGELGIFSSRGAAIQELKRWQSCGGKKFYEIIESKLISKRVMKVDIKTVEGNNVVVHITRACYNNGANFICLDNYSTKV